MSDSSVGRTHGHLN